MKVLHLLLPLVLCSCAQDGPNVVLSDQATFGQVPYIVPVLDQAERNFFGGGGHGGHGGGFGLGGGGVVSGVDLGIDETAEFLGLPPSEARLAIVFPREITPEWELRPALSLSRHDARVFLPQGLGVLTDPMTIDLSAESLTAEIGLVRRQRLSPVWTAEYGGALGIAQVSGRAHFTSALIDLRSAIDLSQPYIAANGRISHENGSGISGQILYYAPNSAEFRLGAFQEF